MKISSRLKGGIYEASFRYHSKLYNEYRDFCKKRGWLMPRQFEIMMEKQLKHQEEVI
jgi:hypothetical protein